MRLRLFLVFATAALSVHAQQFPRIQGETLAGQKITLPDALGGQVTAVIIGFTHAAQNQTEAWVASLEGDLPTDSIAVLEDAPRLVGGMAVHGIKSNVPKDRYDHFIVLYQNERISKPPHRSMPPMTLTFCWSTKTAPSDDIFHGPVTDFAIDQVKSHAAALTPVGPKKVHPAPRRSSAPRSSNGAELSAKRGVSLPSAVCETPIHG